MHYGHFDAKAREYVITRPDTPLPWSNYLGDAEFGSVITNNAAGYTFYRSAAQGRLTRFRFNSPPADWPGKYLYLRDREGGRFWSATWQPAAAPLDRFETTCRHGTGYSIMNSRFEGIEAEVRFFVPLGARHEVWHVTVRNASDQSRKLSLFPFMEPQCNWNALDDMSNLQYTQYIASAEALDGLLDIASNVNMPEDPEHFENKDQARHRFFGVAPLAGAPLAIAGFDPQLAAFLGPYGTYTRPQAVETGACRSSLCAGDMPCTAFQLDADLAPGASASFAVVFGPGRAAVEGRAAVASASSAERLEAALAGVKAHWHERLATLTAQTPDAGFNAMADTWAPFNTLMTFYWSRAASLVYTGERDGLGYRDTVQDIVGAVTLVTDEAKARLELMLTGQCNTGGAMHVVKPFSHRPGHEKAPAMYRADDTLWLFNAVPAYLKETGDLAFLRKTLPYADGGAATVFGHLRRAIEFSLERSGAHGLPCGLHADWNDCLRLGEKGESVFVAFQLRLALATYIDLASRLGEPAEAVWAKGHLTALDANLDKHAWNGGWYLRAYRFDGQTFGAKENEEGTIFMNAQTWAVLSGHAIGARAQQAMDAMHNHLATDCGVMLCAPPYRTTDPHVSLARLFNPGNKENAGVFNHTQGWGVLAAAMLGDGNRAWEYLHSVLPSSFNDRAEVRQVEPYVVCQSTRSRFSPGEGNGRVSWLSGAAVWNYVAMTQGILGLIPDYDGLRIDPCLPANWPGFTATRRFRGKQLTICVLNPDGRQKGVRKLTLNGQPLEDNLIPAHLLRDTNEVEAVL